VIPAVQEGHAELLLVIEVNLAVGKLLLYAFLELLV